MIKHIAFYADIFIEFVINRNSLIADSKLILFFAKEIGHFVYYNLI